MREEAQEESAGGRERGRQGLYRLWLRQARGPLPGRQAGKQARWR